jgi:hypothetical protein
MSGVMAGVAEGHTLPIRLEGSKRQQAFCRRGLAFLSRMIASIFLCGERAKGVVFCLSTVVRRQGFGPQQGGIVELYALLARFARASRRLLSIRCNDNAHERSGGHSF